MDQALFDFSRINKPDSLPLSDLFQVIDHTEFNSKNKYEVKLLKMREEKRNTLAQTKAGFHDDYVLMIRGAPEIIFPKCTRYIKPDGGEFDLDNDGKRIIREPLIQWSMFGRRLIIFCKKTITAKDVEKIKTIYENDFQKWFDSEYHNLVFVGMIGFIDPPKPEYVEFFLFKV